MAQGSRLTELYTCELRSCPRCSITRSFCVDWTTATQCFTASPVALHVWCRALDVIRPHHAGAAGAALASGSTSGEFQDGHPGLPSLSGMAPAYLAADCQLVSDEGRRRHLRSATKDVRCETNSRT